MRPFCRHTEEGERRQWQSPLWRRSSTATPCPCRRCRTCTWSHCRCRFWCCPSFMIATRSTCSAPPPTSTTSMGAWQNAWPMWKDTTMDDKTRSSSVANEMLFDRVYPNSKTRQVSAVFLNANSNKNLIFRNCQNPNDPNLEKTRKLKLD